MEDSYKIKLSKVIDEFKLETLFMPDGDVINVTNPDVNRPGLALADFFGHFDPERIQVIGQSEKEYIGTLAPEVQVDRFDKFLAHKPPAVIYTTSLEPDIALMDAAKKYGVPVLRTDLLTSDFTAALVSSLHVHLAPRITRHGVLVEVYGEGLLIVGDSGIGKSETAIELVKRGHRLVADDAVEIKKVSSKTLVGSAPEIIRHYVEMRGIGIVDVRRLFGMGAVKETERVDCIINLEPWVQGKMYDRLGLESEYTDILGIQIPTMTIPVKTGRNLAIIIEIAAMNNRQKKMGYNTAEEFNERLMSQMEAEM